MTYALRRQQPTDFAIYDTIWRRAGALAIDLLLVGLIVSVSDAASAGLGSQAEFAVVVASRILCLGYFVVLRARGGQTLGKRATGVVVVTNALERPSFVPAVRRYAPAIIYLLVFVAFSWPADVSLQVGAGRAMALVSVISYWIVAEGVTMLASRRRRSLHDLIGGTVVIKRAHHMDGNGPP